MSNTTKEQRPQDKPGLRFLGKLSYFKAPTYTDGGIEKIEVGLGKIHPQKKPEKTLYFIAEWSSGGLPCPDPVCKNWEK